MSNFKFENDKIYSLVTGDLVATVEDGNLKMCPGKNAMTPKVKAFYDSLTEEQKQGAAGNECQDPSAEEEEVNTHMLSEEEHTQENAAAGIFFGGVPETGTSAPIPEKHEEKEKTSEALSVWDIPEENLPEFLPDMGIETPDFKAFVKKHHLTKAQIVELVKRLERNI